MLIKFYRNPSGAEQEIGEQPAHVPGEMATLSAHDHTITSPDGMGAASHERVSLGNTNQTPEANANQGNADRAQRHWTLSGAPLPYPSLNPGAAQYERRRVDQQNMPASSGRYNTAEDHLTVLEAWVFRRAESLSRKPRSWAEVTRHLLPIADFEMRAVIRDQEKAGQSILDLFDLLSSFQQRQIHSLFWEKQELDPDNRFIWELKALKTSPKRAKRMQIQAIQAILERRPRPGSQSHEFPRENELSGPFMRRTHSFERRRPPPTAFDMPPAQPPGPSFEEGRHLSRSSYTPSAPPDLRPVDDAYSTKPRSRNVSFDPDIESSPWGGDYSDDSLSASLSGARRYIHDKSHSHDRYPRRSSSSTKAISGSPHTSRNKEKQIVRADPSKSRQIYDLKESVASIEDDLSDIDRRLEKKFAKIDKQLAICKVKDDAMKDGTHEQVQLRNVDDNGLLRPYNSTDNLEKATVRPRMPPSPTPSMTVENLLSKWTILEHGFANGIGSIDGPPRDPLESQKEAVVLQKAPPQKEQGQQEISISSNNIDPDDTGSDGSLLSVASMD